MPLDRQLKALVKDRVDRSQIGRRTRAARALMLSSIILVLAAVGWWGLAGGATRGRLYSPGHVSRAHARFEQDCKQCHAGDGNGGFRAQITDEACMKCHDGAIHHPNQLVAKTPAGVSREGRILAVASPMAGDPAHARSADCASCHVEHRGQELLAGSSDAHCIVCHADLGRATRPDKPKTDRAIASRVVAFDTTHPNFGARLVGIDPVDQSTRLIDPTMVKFNHLKHLTGEMGLKGDDSCIRCHEFPGISPPATSSDGTAPPPYLTTNAPVVAASPADGRYAQPIRYERHCAGCHQHDMTVAATQGHKEVDSEDTFADPQIAGLHTPHRPVVIVRDFIGGQLRDLLERPVDDFKIAPESEASPKPSPRQSWLAANLKSFGVTPPVEETPAKEGAAVETKADAVTTGPDPLRSADVTLLTNLMAVRTINNSSQCLSCHYAAGEAREPKPEPAEAPQIDLTFISAPTNAPEVFYPGARFDHRAHRDMSCVTCHDSFSAATLTAAAKSGGDQRPFAKSSFIHSPTSPKSCVECHHADTGDARGAGVSCVTCHDFHDRSRELPPRSSIAATRPAPAASEVATTP